MFNLILKHFPSLTPLQLTQLKELEALYTEFNSQLNLISRQDLPNLYLHHVLHSLSIAKLISFTPQTRLLDVGTGGGFPTVPLAIYFPEVHLHAIDSIGKKVKAVQQIVQRLGLTNVQVEQARAEEIKGKYDFILGRGVTALPTFYSWVKKNISTSQHNTLSNGVLYLKGLENFNPRFIPTTFTQVYPLSDFFSYPFFESKGIWHVTPVL